MTGTRQGQPMRAMGQPPLDPRAGDSTGGRGEALVALELEPQKLQCLGRRKEVEEGSWGSFSPSWQPGYLVPRRTSL